MRLFLDLEHGPHVVRHEFPLHQACEVLQRLQVLFAEDPRLAIDHAQGSHDSSIRRANGLPGIEADARLAGDKRIGGKTGIDTCIGNDKRPLC
jgi:hypothetical protein